MAQLTSRLIQDRDVASISIAGGGGDQMLSGRLRLVAIGSLWLLGNDCCQISAPGSVPNLEGGGGACRFSPSERASLSLRSTPFCDPRIQTRRMILFVRLVDAEPLLAEV